MKRPLSIFLLMVFSLGILTAVAMAASGEPESNPEECQLVTETLTIDVDGSGLTDEFETDSDDLFVGYLNETLGDELYATDGKSSEVLGRGMVRDNMNNWEQTIYDALLAKVPSIADGSEASTIFTIDGLNFTAEELGVENLIAFDSEKQENIVDPTASANIDLKIQSCVQKALAAAMHTCPYEMYWFNKQGYKTGEKTATGEDEYCSYKIELFISIEESAGIETGSVTMNLSLAVIDAYRGDGYFITDSGKTTAAASVAAKASAVVAEASGKSDEDKLRYYKDYICSSVSYYQTETPDEIYGDPWQLIYVFDEDPSTNVYCEGYSKAFQYLCDLTEFNDDSIYCITVTGTLIEDKNNHMWNIIHWSDGLNYLADITNCDEGQVGELNNALLRVRTDTGELNEGYTFLDCLYKYDTNTRNIFPSNMLVLRTEAGDFNGNGTIGADDLVFLIKSILGSEAVPAVSTDVNNSGTTDLADAICLLRYLMDESVTLYR